ncbi:MAG: hypothetical protein ACREV4_11490 [Gammaproteobacteria bacterium]
MKDIRLAPTTPIRGFGRQRQKRPVCSRFAFACLTGVLACVEVPLAHAASGHPEDAQGTVIVSQGSSVRIYCDTDAGFQPPAAGPQKLIPACNQKSPTSGFFPNDEGLAVTIPAAGSNNIVLDRGQTLEQNVTITAQTFGQFTVSNAGPLAVSTPVDNPGDLANPPPHAVSLICETFASPADERHCVKVNEGDEQSGGPGQCGGLQVTADDCTDEIAALGDAFSAPKANWILEIPDPSLVGNANSETVKVCVVNASWECADTQNLGISGSVQGQVLKSVVFTPICVKGRCF